MNPYRQSGAHWGQRVAPAMTAPVTQTPAGVPAAPIPAVDPVTGQAIAPAPRRRGIGGMMAQPPTPAPRSGIGGLMHGPMAQMQAPAAVAQPGVAGPMGAPLARRF